MRKTGVYEPLGAVNYFVPDPLPPKNPPLVMDDKMWLLYGETLNQLGKINEMAHRLPNAHRFIKAYVIKEGLLTSAIEGIHTTLIDLFTQPLLDAKPNKNIELVLNYTKALEAALSMIRTEGFPIVTSVICKAHEALMTQGSGEKASPGRFRKQGVKVGNLVPPQANKIADLMSDLERYINIDDTLPPLIKAGLAHVQFETIHPFLDGNGRIGRLLIILMLIESGLLSEPILYPSYYFKKYSLDYYRLLDRVRTDGDFEGWIRFYLTAIQETCIDVYKRADDIEILTNDLNALVSQQEATSKKQESRLLALSLLFSHPVVDISLVSNELGISYNTADAIVSDFIKLGILVPQIEQKRHRLFRFRPYLDLLEKEY